MENLIITSHAQARMRQRGIAMQVVETLALYGRRRHAKGAVRIDFDKRARARVGKALNLASMPDHLFNTYLVMNGDKLISVGHRTKRFNWN